MRSSLARLSSGVRSLTSTAATKVLGSSPQAQRRRASHQTDERDTESKTASSPLHQTSLKAPPAETVVVRADRGSSPGDARGTPDECFDYLRKRGESDLRDSLGASGLMVWCDLLGLNPETDVAGLVLLHGCDTAGMFDVTRVEFHRGLEALLRAAPEEEKLTKLEEVLDFNVQKRLLSNLVETVMKRDLRAFHRGVFQRALVGTARVVPKDLVADLLRVVFLNPHHGPQVQEHVRRLAQYLNDHPRLKVVRADEWNRMLDLITTIDLGFCEYSLEDAWPTLLDEYVESERDKAERA